MAALVSCPGARGFFQSNPGRVVVGTGASRIPHLRIELRTQEVARPLRSASLCKRRRRFIECTDRIQGPVLDARDQDSSAEWQSIPTT